MKFPDRVEIRTVPRDRGELLAMMVERATQDGSIRRVAHRQVDLFLDGISTSTEQARRGGSWVDPRPRPTTGWRGAPRLEPTDPP